MATETVIRPHSRIASGNRKHQMQLAESFASDMKLGLELQEQVGPWVAHLGSSASKPGSQTYQTSYNTGSLIVSKLGLPVGTGGSSGTMAAANQGAKESGGLSVGIYLEGLPSEQAQNPYCTHSISCKTLLARQHLLLSGACAVVVAPEGGWGTIFEIGHELIELRRHSFDSCPIVIVDQSRIWWGLYDWLEKELVARGLWKPSNLEHLALVSTPEEAIDLLSKHLLQLP